MKTNLLTRFGMYVLGIKTYKVKILHSYFADGGMRVLARSYVVRAWTAKRAHDKAQRLDLDLYSPVDYHVFSIIAEPLKK